MKKIVLGFLLTVLLAPQAKSQFFSGEGVLGGVIGALAGQAIGGDTEATLIGAGAGLLGGTIMGMDQRQRSYSPSSSYSRRPSNYSNRGYSSYRPRSYSRGNNGFISNEGMMGGVVGALAGQAIGHDTEATLIGAGAGLLGGTILGMDQRQRGYSSSASGSYRPSYSSYRPSHSYGYTGRNNYTGNRYQPAYYQQPTQQYRQPVYASPPVVQQPAYVPTQAYQQPACSSSHQPTIIIIQQGGGGGYRYSY